MSENVKGVKPTSPGTAEPPGDAKLESQATDNTEGLVYAKNAV